MIQTCWCGNQFDDDFTYTGQPRSSGPRRKYCSQSCASVTQQHLQQGRSLLCLDCGTGPFHNLSSHVFKTHGTVREYRQRHGIPSRQPLVSKFVSDAQRWDMLERIREGHRYQAPRRRVCNKGHRMVGHNVMTDRDGNRRCRACFNQWHRDYNRKRRVPKPQSTCEWCGQKFVPTVRHQRFHPRGTHRCYSLWWFHKNQGAR